MAGVPVVLGIDDSPYGYMVQSEGEALRIPAQDIRTAMRHSPSLHAGFLRYAHALMVQTAQTAYANAGFTIEARLSRWVLMTDDRLERDELPLTHDFLSMMLGVRRLSPIRFPCSPEWWRGDEARQAEAQAPQAPREQGDQAAGNVSALRGRSLFSAGVRFATASHMPVDTAQ